MSGMIAETERHRGGVIEIRYDEGGAMSPRDDESNLSIIVCPSNRNWKLPNEVDFDFDAEDNLVKDGGKRQGETPGEWVKRILRTTHKATYITNIYMMEHGGVGLSVSDYGDRWDSGQVGWAIVTKATQKEIGTPDDLVAECVKGEVERYGQYLNGEVYGWVAKLDGEELDSCWGYMGSEEWDYMKGEAKDAIDYALNERDEKANDIAADAMAALVHG